MHAETVVAQPRVEHNRQMIDLIVLQSEFDGYCNQCLLPSCMTGHAPHAPSGNSEKKNTASEAGISEDSHAAHPCNPFRKHVTTFFFFRIDGLFWGEYS